MTDEKTPIPDWSVKLEPTGARMPDRRGRASVVSFLERLEWYLWIQSEGDA